MYILYTYSIRIYILFFFLSFSFFSFNTNSISLSHFFSLSPSKLLPYFRYDLNDLVGNGFERTER